MTIDPLAYLRTILPALIGSLLTWAGAHIPAVIGWLDSIDTNWRAFVYAVLTAAVIAAYYWVARQAGKKWPWIERLMLGSSKLPAYSTPTPATPAAVTTAPAAPVDDVVDATVPDPVDATDAVSHISK